MGCGISNSAATTQMHSRQTNVEEGNVIQKSRTDRKYQKINGRFQSQGADILKQNVKRIESETLSVIDETRIHQILKNHFFFSGMSHYERTEIVKKMIVCRSEVGSYIFKQGDLASAFFIISDGKVEVEINGEKRKFLSKDEYFGELALIYGAPRSAAIRAVEDTSLWCLTRTNFRTTVEEYVKKNYSLAKIYINKLPVFSFLTEKQKDSISYNMVNLRYQDNEIIFKENDDANSFFVITKGKVEISIPGKDKLALTVGDSFGQQSFVQNQVRIGTAIAKGQTHCLSIGREVVKNILGDRISNITNYNITKWALKRSKVLSKLSSVELEKLIQTTDIKDYEDGDKVYKKGQVPKYLAVSLQGIVEDRVQGVLIGEEMLAFRPNQTIPKDLMKIGRGLVALIYFEAIMNCTNKKISELTSVEAVSYEKQMESNNNRKSQDFAHVRLEKLIHMKKLGQGQFGKVYLVKQSEGSSKFYALKCIKKQQVIENKMQKIILEQKHILETINFPLMLTFMKSFKDSQHIYFLLEYIKGSELFDVIREIGILSKAIGRFYISSLILSMEYLHMKNIIYRDLKPQNVMVEYDGYLKLIDMGTAKLLTEQKGFRTFTIIGTPHYMAPEVMQGKGYTFAVDLWSLGILLYEFLCGQLPFADHVDDPYEIHRIITKEAVRYPSFFLDETAKRLIQQLLNKSPDLRMPKGFPALKAHSYFDGFQWEELYNKKMKAPYLPKKTRGSDRIQLQEGGRFISLVGSEKGRNMSVRQSPIRNWDEEF